MHKQLALYGEHGYPIQRRHAGEPIAFLVTESGALNSYVHLWAYEDAGHRERSRAALQADPDWVEYLARSAREGNIVSQENRLMVPAPFFKLGK